MVNKIDDDEFTNLIWGSKLHMVGVRCTVYNYAMMIDMFRFRIKMLQIYMQTRYGHKVDLDYLTLTCL